MKWGKKELHKLSVKIMLTCWLIMYWLIFIMLIELLYYVTKQNFYKDANIPCRHYRKFWKQIANRFTQGLTGTWSPINFLSEIWVVVCRWNWCSQRNAFYYKWVMIIWEFVNFLTSNGGICSPFFSDPHTYSTYFFQFFSEGYLFIFKHEKCIPFVI